MQPRELLDAFLQRLPIRDGLAAVHALGLVARRLHGDGAGGAGALHVADGRAAQVVEEPALEPGPLAGIIPGAAHRADGLAPAVEDAGVDTPRLALEGTCLSPLSSRRSRRSTPKGEERPSSFLVVPGATRTSPASKSTSDYVSPRTSAFHQSVRVAKRTTGRSGSGSSAITHAPSPPDPCVLRLPHRRLLANPLNRPPRAAEMPGHLAHPHAGRQHRLHRVSIDHPPGLSSRRSRLQRPGGMRMHSLTRCHGAFKRGSNSRACRRTSSRPRRLTCKPHWRSRSPVSGMPARRC